MTDKKPKALLIKLSSLGDVVFNIPLANALKKAGYEVTWLVSEKGIQVVENNPCVDKAILVPNKEWKKRGFCLKSFRQYLQILKYIRSQKFDVAIDTQMLLKSMYWMIFSGAKKRITSIEAREFAFLGANTILPKISLPGSPIVKNYLRFGKPIGLDQDEITVTLPKRSQEQVNKINELLKNIDSSKPIAVIAPATTWENKHWNKDNWRKVIDSISDRMNIIFTGGPNDNKLIEYISCGEYMNLAGKTDILELIELFSRADLVIAPDSGSAHLAWATQKPAVITIFTCTPKDVLAPYGPDDKYIAISSKCNCKFHPCFKRKCMLTNNQNICTYSPTPEQILGAIEHLIFNKNSVKMD